MKTTRPRFPATAFPCTFDMILAAPEMTLLRVLHDALHFGCLALLAQHPSLASDFSRPNDPPTLHKARRLLVRARALEHALRDYARAVEDAIRPLPTPDDVDF